MPRYTEASKYEILYDLPDGEYNQREVGSICTKTIIAGDSLEVEAFPVICIDKAAKQEAEERRSSEAQQKLNLENSRKDCIRLMEANFKHGDILLHPTYDYGFIERSFCNLEDVLTEWRRIGIPESDEDVTRDLRNLFDRAKRRVKRKGGDPKEFKYIYVIECKRKKYHEDFNALPPRYHVHMAISSCGVLTIDDINELWPFGRTDAALLDFRFNGLEALGKYIVKESLKKNSKKYRYSRNMVKPEIKRSFRKLSRRKAARIAEDVRANAREIFEKLYPGYSLQDCVVKYSDFVAGAYIYARMRRQVLTKNDQRRRR